MLRTDKQHPFSAPMFALDFIEELANEPIATAFIKEAVDNDQWWALRTIERKRSGKIRIEHIAPEGGAARYGERLVIAVDNDFRLSWVVQPGNELLRLEIVSEEQGDRLWQSRCAVCLHWEEGAPENLLYVKEWIDNNRVLARIRAGADDLRRSLSMHG